jgi:hypothetical protein
MADQIVTGPQNFQQVGTPLFGCIGLIVAAGSYFLLGACNILHVLGIAADR